MTLYMLQMQPEMNRLIRWAEAQNLLPRRGEDDLGYALHAVLAAAFGELTPKPFALCRDPARPATLLAYSAHDVALLREHATAFAEPNVTAALRLEDMAGKVMPEQFVAGRRMGFSVRVRPTIRTDRDGNRDKVREVDAFLAAVTDTPPGEGPDRGTVYQKWLMERLEASGAVPEHMTMDAFRLSDVQRRNQTRMLGLRRGPDATFSGVLRVVDAERFRDLLARGIGRHRSFGFGMLLLRPV